MIENLSSLFWKCLSFLLEKKKKKKSLFWEMSTFAFVLFCLKKKKKIHQGNFERWRLGWLYAIRPINFLYSNLKKHKQSLAQFCRLFKLHTQPTTANGYFSSLFSFLSFFLLCFFSFFFTGSDDGGSFLSFFLPLAAYSLSSSPVLLYKAHFFFLGFLKVQTVSLCVLKPREE